VNSAYELLNNRTDHSIEGFEEAGMMRDEFYSNLLGWQSLTSAPSTLSPEQLTTLNLQLTLHPHLKRRQIFTPQEALNSHRTQLIQLPDAAVPDLLGKAFGEIKTVSPSGSIEFTRPEFHGKLRYRATYQDSNGYQRRLNNGQEILIHFNPFLPDYIYLSDPSTGRYIGRSVRDQAITRGDVESTHRRFSEAQSELKDAVRETAHRHGLGRIPGMQANTRALRDANKPTARQQTVADNFAPNDLLDGDNLSDQHHSTSDYSDPSTYFDPADMLS
ncbi:MAG: hypothetical protein ACRC2U_01355, partial [Aeromonas sp.]